MTEQKATTFLTKKFLFYELIGTIQFSFSRNYRIIRQQWDASNGHIQMLSPVKIRINQHA